MLKSKIWIFILLALAALVLQLLVSQGRLPGSQCCPRNGPDLLMGYPGKSNPGGGR